MAADRNIVVAVDELDVRFITGVDVQVGSAVVGLLDRGYRRDASSRLLKRTVLFTCREQPGDDYCEGVFHCDFYSTRSGIDSGTVPGVCQ